MATWIKADGTREAVLPANPKGKKKPKFALEELQRYVGGYIEMVRLGRRGIMWVNEEGKLMGLPYNAAATEIVGSVSYQLLAGTGVIVGDVLITEAGEV